MTFFNEKKARMSSILYRYQHVLYDYCRSSRLTMVLLDIKFRTLNIQQFCDSMIFYKTYTLNNVGIPQKRTMQGIMFNCCGVCCNFTRTNNYKIMFFGDNCVFRIFGQKPRTWIINNVCNTCYSSRPCIMNEV